MTQARPCVQAGSDSRGRAVRLALLRAGSGAWSAAGARLGAWILTAFLSGGVTNVRATVVPQFLECINLSGATQLNYCSTDPSRQAAALKAGGIFCANALSTGFTACTFSNWVAIDSLQGQGTLHSCGPNGVCSDNPLFTLGGPGPLLDTCTIATAISGPCGATVAAMKSIAKDPSDNTRIFHATQTCIAERSCALRCNMDNCDWLKTVVPDFINPYLNKTGNWPKVESDCAGYGFGTYGALWCARSMAMNHIYNDLIPALAKTGCGSDGDWNKVYEVIKTCTTESIPNSAPLGTSQYATLSVYRYRQEARGSCKAARSAAGLPADINPSAQGLVCTP